MKKLFLLLTAIMATLSASAYDFEAGGLYFNILSEEEKTCGLVNETYTGDGYYGESNYAGDIVIPETVEFNGNTYTVTEILGGAFYSANDQLKSVKMPNTIVKIGRAAFENCYGLTNVTLSNKLEKIEAAVFWNCRSLASIDIPETVTWIGYCAFFYCESLETIVLPNSLTNLGNDEMYGFTGGVFSGCSSLKSINIPTSLTTLAPSLFSGCTNLSSIEIPDNIQTIGGGAFAYCSSLTELNIPASVKEIPYSPIFGCSGLTKLTCAGSEYFFVEDNVLCSTDGRLIGALDRSSITVPETVKTIGSYAFAYCNNLKSVNLPNSLTEIGELVFYYCENLESAVIPNSVISIGRGLFSCCSSLKSVELPHTLDAIGYEMFANCYNLEEVEIPSTVKRIDGYAFSKCTSLRSINIPASVTEINGNPFKGCSSLENMTVEGDNFQFENYCMIADLDYYGKSVIFILDKEKITIPDYVEAINWGAFDTNEKLETVVIPESVTYVTSFYDCPNLKSIHVYGKPENFRNFSPGNPNNDYKIYVRKAYLEEFISYWPYLADRFVGLDLKLPGDLIYDENENQYSITSIDEDNKTCALVYLKSIKEVYIPESVEGFTVTAIMRRFARLSTTKLVLPKTIKTICDNAFNANNLKITEVYIFAESMDEYGTEVFKIKDALKIYVPENSVEIYKAAWPEAADHIYAMDETMAISSISADKNRSGKTINLAGQPVDENYKGIVIRNGKKMLRK